MKRRLIIVLLAIIVTWPLPGQEKPADARQQMEYVYGNLDADRIPTGFLHNKVIAFATAAEHNGQQPSAPLTADMWMQLYHQLTAAAVRENKLLTLADIRRENQDALSQNTIPLAIINRKYNTMQADAVDRGAILRSDRRFLDGVGDPSTAYRKRRLFAASPLKSTLYGLDHRFLIREYSGRITDIQTLEIDFGDGRGFRKVSRGSLVDIGYPQAGRYLITTRLSGSDGSLLSIAEIEIRNPPWLKAGTTPDIILENQVATLSYANRAAGYDVYVFLGEGNRSIRQPMLVVEGFDLENTTGWEEIFDRLSAQNLVQQLLADGRDIVILNFDNATDYIQRNAFALVDVINWVREEKPSEEPLTIAGVSMGGLVARYGLSWMEDQQMPHDTGLLLSFDAPQQGANIPLGLQYWVWFFSEYNSKADRYREIVNSPAATQMLATHYNHFPAIAPVRTTLYEELASMGNYPQHWMLRKVALASGSGAGVDGRQVNLNGAFMSPGSRLIEWQHRSFLVDVDGDVWAVPDHSPQRQIFEGLVNILGPQNEDIDVFVSGTTPYDNAPGGWSNTNQQIADENPEIEVLGQIVNLGDIRTNFPNHGFIYFASALDLRDASGEPLEPFHNALADPDLLSKSPFDTIYFPPGTANQEHLEIDAENAAFILEQLAYLPDEITVADATIDQPHPTAKARLHIVTDRNAAVAEGGDIALVSGSSISLKPGFSVQAGAGFRASIDVALQQRAQVRKDLLAAGKSSHWPAVAVENKQDEKINSSLPGKFVLHQNYPNPFNPHTVIGFQLAEAALVTLDIYDVLGRHVKTLYRASLPSGTHKFVWDATDAAGNSLSSGVYYYRLVAGDFVATRKMMLMQ